MCKLDRKRRAAILFFVVISLLTFLEYTASGAVLKWKDDKGSIHFTDNINNIPKAFRKPPYLLNVPKFLSPRAENAKGGGEGLKISENDKSNKKEEIEPGRLGQEEKAAIQEAISLLRKEAQRNEGLVKMMPSERTGKTFAADIQGSLQAKKQLEEKLSKSKSPEAQAAYKFLQASIKEDEQVKVSGPRMKNRTVRTLNRLKSEMQTESGIADNLEKLLQEDDKKEALEKNQGKQKKKNLQEQPFVEN